MDSTERTIFIYPSVNNKIQQRVSNEQQFNTLASHDGCLHEIQLQKHTHEQNRGILHAHKLYNLNVLWRGQIM